MKKNSILFVLVFVVFCSFVLVKEKQTTVYLIGDSTIANKDVKAYPETGWGMPFSGFFDSSVVVDNRAKNGRSTRTFIEEGLWKPVIENLQQGDYVFIQFGHNDEVETKKSFTIKEQFTANLAKYVTETRAKKGLPVLLTPVARRRFDSSGRIVGTHDVYSELVRGVAKQMNVPLIDLDKKSQAMLQDLGVEGSKLLFNHLVPGEHPNYPDGKTDDTHFSELGARKMATLVLAEIRQLKLDLASRIYAPAKKN
ncbi:MAG: rhamnogalacturonan acetylesterase [Chitinophagaceae bacterium]|nr:MAG: rhamnogalacturonan acetylesterase [Chitinophagaceae bacterium]